MNTASKINSDDTSSISRQEYRVWKESFLSDLIRRIEMILECVDNPKCWIKLMEELNA